MLRAIANPPWIQSRTHTASACKRLFLYSRVYSVLQPKCGVQNSIWSVDSQENH